jgi:CBS domain-containing protein/Flp pilus assembly pilin Flp
MNSRNVKVGIVMVRWKRLLADEHGTTTTEYAIIITLIAAALMLASDGVRLAADSGFRRTTVAFGGTAAGNDASSAAASRASSPSEASGFAARLRELPIAAMPPTHAVAWGVLVCAAGIVAHTRRRQRLAQRGVEPIECSQPPPADEPSNPNFLKRQEIQRVLLRHFDEALHSQIEVRHVMSRHVRAVQPATSVADLRTLMESERFHHLLVLAQDKLVGVVSDRDMRGRSGRRAADVMTAAPTTVAPSTPIGQAITILLHHQISCLPVVEDDRVQGILTTTDMLMTLQCLMQLLDRSHTGQQPVETAPTRTITALVKAAAAC